MEETCNEMYARVRGRGAQDGWYDLAIQMELASIKGEHIAGAAADVHKCFDQIQRELVYKIADAAGIPTRVLTAYRSVQESLTAGNAVAGHMGMP